MVTPQPTIAPAEGAVQLQYWDMQWGETSFMSALQDNVTEFNRTHPDINVTFTEATELGRLHAETPVRYPAGNSDNQRR